MKKKIVLIIGAIFMLTACGEVPKLNNGDDAILSFKNDKNLSVNDLYKEMKDTYALSVMINMMDRHILEAKYKDKIEATETKAETEVDRIKNMFGYDGENFNEDFFLSYLRQSYGVNNVEALYDIVYLNYMREYATNDYVKTKITDKEITKYYTDNVFGDIEASHILIKPEVDEDMSSSEKKDAEAKALKEAKEIIADLKDAEKLAEEFAKIAKEKSDDPGSASAGGALGAFNKGKIAEALGKTTMVEEFEKAAFALKLNEMSKEPVKTEHGYHIILKTKEYDKAKLDTIKNEIINTIVDEKIEEKSIYSIEAIIELRKEYKMEINDSLLKEQYGQYMNYIINQAIEDDKK